MGRTQKSKCQQIHDPWRVSASVDVSALSPRSCWLENSSFVWVERQIRCRFERGEPFICTWKGVRTNRGWHLRMECDQWYEWCVVTLITLKCQNLIWHMGWLLHSSWVLIYPDSSLPWAVLCPTIPAVFHLSPILFLVHECSWFSVEPQGSREGMHAPQRVLWWSRWASLLHLSTKISQH